jgi:hypothetical protein
MYRIFDAKLPPEQTKSLRMINNPKSFAIYHESWILVAK